MKRCLTLAPFVAGLLILVWWWRGYPPNPPGTPDLATVPNSNSPTAASEPAPTNAAHAKLVVPPGEDPMWFQHPEVIRAMNEAQNVPVYFYGLVVDQDTNPVQNVTVYLDVIERYVDQTTATTEKATRLQKQTGADGRFEVSGLSANYVRVQGFTKDGYEREIRQKQYGDYGAQSTSFDHPAVFNLWSTNHHEQLVTGNKSFVVIPDGRHYAIDLLKGTIAEGDDGDLVAWIKRPESARRGQRYDWSCA